jgi:hypothetical protein
MKKGTVSMKWMATGKKHSGANRRTTDFLFKSCLTKIPSFLSTSNADAEVMPNLDAEDDAILEKTDIGNGIFVGKGFA